MRVALVTPVYPPYRGGIGAVAENDARNLRARGLTVTVLTPDYPGRAHNPEAEYVTPWLAVGNAAVMPGLFRRLDGQDLVHLHYTFYGADILVWLWSKLKRQPYVLTYHMRPQAGDWRDLFFRLHRLVMEPLIVRGAKVVFVSSLDYAQSIGLQHRRLVELPFGVDEQRFSPGRDDEYRVRLGLPLDACVFIFVGGLDQAHVFKGVEILIQAAAQLPKAQTWRVLVVGDGDLKASFIALADRLGVRDRMVFAGAISDADLPRAYRAADVHVLPSTSRSEAFGLVTLEAAASGLPSIVSDLPGVRSVIQADVTGFVVAPRSAAALATALKKCLQSPALAKQMGLKARARVLENYTAASLADRLMGVYNGITATSEL